MHSLGDVSIGSWFVFFVMHATALLVFLVVRPLARIATRELHGYSATSWTIPPLWVAVWNGFLERLLIAGVTFYAPDSVALVAVAWIAGKTAIGWRGIWGDDVARRVRGMIGLWASVASILVGIGTGIYLRDQA